MTFVIFASAASAATIVRSGEGPDAASIQAIVDQFRADLGDPNNGNMPGSQPGGRREINWDGGGAAANAVIDPSPSTRFANRGNVNTTPGTGLELSGQPSPEFGEINPTYPDIFTTFSSPRLFAPLGSNIVDVLFTIPGRTDVPALSKGFGAVFTDVDLADTTTLEFFNANGVLIGTHSVTPFNNGLSFLGVSFDAASISRVRITSGNSPLGPNDGGGIDVVALDDFIFGEPQPIPEPSTMALAGLSVLLVVAGSKSSIARLRHLWPRRL